MEGIRQYALSVLCAGLIVSILLELSSKAAFHKQLRLVCGIFFSVVLLRPLMQVSLPEWEAFSGALSQQAEQAALEGENIRIRSLSSVIREECEAYILKEAERIGAEVEVTVELDTGYPPAPTAITLRGSFDASSEGALSSLLAEEIGIPKERQTWIRQPKPSSGESGENTSLFS